MSGEKLTHVSEEKKKLVSELAKLAKEHKTILVASIKDVPAADFQEIVKKLRGKAVVKVPKKSIIFRAFDASGEESIKKIKEQVKESTAILFSDMDSYELAGELLNSKNPAKAKAGQEAPEDIEIPEGPTELVPGPAISELGALGIQIKIDKGKINIKQAKVIVKKGGKISSAAADLMSKLNIKPFSVGFTPLASFDKEEGKLYVDLKIDREGTLEELKMAFGKALPFAVEIGYSSKETIKFLLGKAGMHGKAFEKFVGGAEDKNVANANEDKSDNEQQDSKLKVESKAEPVDEAKPEEKPETSEEITEDIKKSGVAEEVAKKEEKLDEKGTEIQPDKSEEEK